ncbi:SAVED domain-containing protein [Ralstonia wenshanensis]|uniref:SAVED domain-containing protein n=1 Tax=Ralstonia wenshanensis TaxID=2842456 RepID=UPI002AAD6192|nr:SAVED domain-containing protein [Ralstonia wenshanensis]MDY7508799.1 SAVED domain-containing protein [Ralstonia wenshanensis]
MATGDTQCAVPLSDDGLAQLLSGQAGTGAQVLVVANGFTARVAALMANGAWEEIGRGDFGLRSGAAAKRIAEAGKLMWWDVASSPAACDFAAATATRATSGAIDEWLTNAEKLTGTGGRGDAPKKDDQQYLAYLAGWRCQFAGCGKDLQRENLSGTAGNFSYFAHIIASSPKGPRGDKLLSGQQADVIDNIMLMCDECHRRIDRVDPDRFTIDVLRKMRQDSINEVRRLLDTLRYEEVLPIVVMGNITAQSPRFLQRDAEEALWTRRLRMTPSGPEHYFYNGGHLHNPHVPHYWGSLFDALSIDIPLLRKRLNGTLRADGKIMPLAVFPLHGTSILVLAGRIVGEGSRITVFQFNRDRPVDLPGGKWAFDEGSPPAAADKYCVKELAPYTGGEEACLVVSLTYKVEASRLPATLHSDGAFKVGALEVTASDPAALRHDIISHHADLDGVSVALEHAIRRLQDEWRVERVHLFIGAPASACFRIGQKLQARHHAAFVCYETLPGGGTPFLPTIEISNTEVEELQSHQVISLA